MLQPRSSHSPFEKRKRETFPIAGTLCRRVKRIKQGVETGIADEREESEVDSEKNVTQTLIARPVQDSNDNNALKSQIERNDERERESDGKEWK